MNRLHHLQTTLPYNLECCDADINLEFVILDYNSTDGLEEWIYDNAQHFKGKVQYFKNHEPQFYKRSHSRNMAMKLATGDVLCNLDADNFVGKGFLSYIKESFSSRPNIFVSPSENLQSDVFGKLCFKKSDFLSIGGYDEKIELYGFEDNDLKNRLTMLGLETLTFENPDFVQAIAHTELERIENEFLYKNLNRILVKSQNAFKSRLFFCLKDGTYESVIIEDSQFSTSSDSVRPLDQRKRYNMAIDSEKKGLEADLDTDNHSTITDQKVIIETIHFYSQLKNKSHTEKKLKSQTLVANVKEGFGKGIVFQNRNLENPITID